MASIQGTCAASHAQAAGGKALPTRGSSAGRGVVDLSANENPLGPSPNVLAAIVQAAAQAHRYPEKQGPTLKSALAGRLGGVPFKYFADWTDAVAKGALPHAKPPRPHGTPGRASQGQLMDRAACASSSACRAARPALPA